MPKDPYYDPTRTAITAEIGESYYQQSVDLYNHGKVAQAQDALKQYVAIAGSTSKGQDLQDSLNSAPMDPLHQDITTIDATAIQKQDQINKLLVQGEAQYLYGDNDTALHTFDQVLNMDHNNVVAKSYEVHITAAQLEAAHNNRDLTRDEFLKDIEDKWQRADIFVKEPQATETPGANNDAVEITKKLKKIVIPVFTFKEGTRLDDVAAQLAEASKSYDSDVPPTGVNIVMVPASTGDIPTIKVMSRLTDVSLETILNNLEEQTGYTYSIEDKIVKFRSGGGAAGELNGEETRAFPMPDSTMINLIGPTDSGSSTTTSTDPFKQATPSATGGSR